MDGRIGLMSAAVVALLAAPAFAWTDGFAPATCNEIARHWGIGCGVGYHARPCDPIAARHYDSVTGMSSWLTPQSSLAGCTSFTGGWSADGHLDWTVPSTPVPAQPALPVPEAGPRPALPPSHSAPAREQPHSPPVLDPLQPSSPTFGDELLPQPPARDVDADDAVDRNSAAHSWPRIEISVASNGSGQTVPPGTAHGDYVPWAGRERNLQRLPEWMAERRAAQQREQDQAGRLPEVVGPAFGGDLPVIENWPDGDHTSPRR